MTNCGLGIKLSLTCTLNGQGHFVTLGCAEPLRDLTIEERENIGESNMKDQEAPHQICLYVAHIDGDRFTRTRAHQWFEIKSAHSDYQLPILHTLCVPQDYHAMPPTQKKRIFHMQDPKQLEKVERDPLSRAIKEVLERFLPHEKRKELLSPTKAQTVEFSFVGCTNPGHLGTTHEFELGLGGKVGVLFKPSQPFVSPIVNPEQALEFIAVIFGVGFDDSLYADISGISLPELRKIYTKWRKESKPSNAVNTKRKKTIMPVVRSVEPPLADDVKIDEWIKEYVKDFSTKASSMKVEKEIWDLMFSVELLEMTDNAGADQGFNVSMSYRSK
ncbi:hypothetical protein L207DRAFT_533890 [Hyaloscypha variabilis F]|uniref:Uncharacterized protein n=1 Tax=Hyaloscypha variabilis (strain UAMH 11265 / GT02V1 / F) TaxID=1149755 RepID=A0A2J6R7S1_HYAVF|nr:hypothetical protein L207DRAFT_533890 [Hyaloscypha variabilis F]